MSVATVTPGPQAVGGSLLRLPGLHSFPRPRAVAELSHLIEFGRFDVIHVHSSLVSPLAWAGAVAGTRSEIPTVLTMHSMLPGGMTARSLRALSPRLGTNVVWTAVSSAAASSLRAAVPNRDVAVLPNGIDPDDWARDGNRTTHRPLTLVCVMRTVRRKRPLQLLDILAAIRRDIPASMDLRAILVGSGPLDRAISRKLARSGMDSWVTQTGSLARTEIRELLQHCDVYLAPATLESFGIAALEARSAGLPVIGMAGGGISDFIEHGVEGFLVDSDAAMASHATRLLTAPLELSRIRHHNRSYHPTISWPQVLELHEAVYAAARCPYRDPQPVGHPLDFAEVGCHRRDADSVLDSELVD